MARVLLVDDDPTIRAAYQIILKQAGYQLDVASDGKQALELATANQPDVVLLDLMMPNMNGLEFLQSYDLAKHPKVKVIVFSNSDVKEDEAKAMEMGAYKNYPKAQYSPKEVLSFIEEAVTKSAQTQ